MNQTLKTFFPPEAISPIKTFSANTKCLILRCVAWSDFLCTLYYTFFSRAFRREQRAVVAGLIKHFDKNRMDSQFFILRRNIHRLEKALLMRPRREFFALDYILDTVKCYEICIKFSVNESYRGDLIWATDILHTYFENVGDQSLVKRAKAIFESITLKPDTEKLKIPYKRCFNESIVSYEALFELSQKRRSVRWFEQREVPRELIDKAIVLGAQAPSSCNRQPFFYRIFDEKKTVSELVKIPIGTAGFQHNIPVICIVIGDLSAYFGERDRHGIYIDASLSIMSFMLALETLGLSSCALNWPDIKSREKKMEKMLNLDKNERIIMCIAIGYPDKEGMVAYSQKRELAEIRIYNELRT